MTILAILSWREAQLVVRRGGLLEVQGLDRGTELDVGRAAHVVKCHYTRGRIVVGLGG